MIFLSSLTSNHRVKYSPNGYWYHWYDKGLESMKITPINRVLQIYLNADDSLISWRYRWISLKREREEQKTNVR